ncbi:glycosyltransferase family 2 protein [Escherichia coli]|nr:glycosyltransferase family 2 protein [Escherichia coli]
MTVIAIVVTFNRCALLKKVLHSLLSQSIALNKIIIIDNDSNDDTAKVVHDFSEVDDIFYYHNTGDNLGGAGGFYQGFKIAEQFYYDYLWLMDDDLLPEPDCLEKLIQDRPEGIVQPVRYDLDGACAEISPVEYNLQKIFCRNPKTKTVKEVISTVISDNCREIDIAGVPFEGPLISKSVVNKVGYPNPDFFIFNDDLDYSLRTRSKGFSIKCIVDARATRLLKNNQKNDLKSWKGYFMLRNHYYILRNYGENKLVKNRVYLIMFYYFLKSVFSFDYKFAKVVIFSFKDSFSLKNSKRFRP